VLGWLLAGINAHDELPQTGYSKATPVLKNVILKHTGFLKT
jgi:hypothetical protein